MIEILLCILYIALGVLYTEHMWNMPEIQEEIEKITSIAPSEITNGPLAVIKLLSTAFWPLFIAFDTVIFIMWKCGYQFEEEDEE